MSIKKNLDDPSSKKHWDRIQKIAKEVNSWPEEKKNSIKLLVKARMKQIKTS